MSVRQFPACPRVIRDPTTWFGCVCALAIATLLAGADSSSAGVLGSWTQYQGNAAHTAYIPGTVKPADIAPIWSVSSNSLGMSHLNVGAVTDANHVYLTAYSHFSYETRGSSTDFVWNYKAIALDRLSGQEMWTRQLKSYDSTTSAPSIGNGKVYVHVGGESSVVGAVPSRYPQLVGVDAASGAVSFSTPHLGRTANSPPTVHNDRVYVETGEINGVSGFTSNGHKLWDRGLSWPYRSIAAADDQYVYTYSTKVNAIVPNSGATAFSITPQDNSGGNLVLGDLNDAIAVAETHDEVKSFDLEGRVERWSRYGDY